MINKLKKGATTRAKRVSHTERFRGAEQEENGNTLKVWHYIELIGSGYCLGNPYK